MTVQIPLPEALPVSWGWFHGLLMLVFPMHLLLMNAMLGFALLSLYLCLRGGTTNRRLAGELAKGLPVLIALAVNLGIPALLFLQVLYGQFFYTSSVLMAVFWLGVPLLLVAAYYAAYVYDFRFDSLGKRGAAVVGFASILFLAIAFLFTGNMTLMLEPHRWSGYFSRPWGTLLEAGTGAPWPRYLHFVTSGVAVGALSVAVFGRWKERHDPVMGERGVRIGMHAFTTLTALQLGLGSWYLMSLPRPVMLLFMGKSPGLAALLLSGVALTLLLLWTGFRRNVAWSAGLAALLVYVMAFLRDGARSGYLAPFHDPAARAVVPNPFPLLLFAVSLAAGLVVIAWMARKTLEACRQTD